LFWSSYFICDGVTVKVGGFLEATMKNKYGLAPAMTTNDSESTDASQTNLGHFTLDGITDGGLGRYLHHQFILVGEPGGSSPFVWYVRIKDGITDDKQCPGSLTLDLLARIIQALQWYEGSPGSLTLDMLARISRVTDPGHAGQDWYLPNSE
jgi:hypothetical protein